MRHLAGPTLSLARNVVRLISGGREDRVLYVDLKMKTVRLDTE
jgi:hypothetical protein